MPLAEVWRFRASLKLGAGRDKSDQREPESGSKRNRIFM